MGFERVSRRCAWCARGKGSAAVVVVAIVMTTAFAKLTRRVIRDAKSFAS